MRPAALAALLPLSLAQQSIPDPPPGFNVPTLPTGTVRPGSCGETVKGPCAGGAAAAGVAGAWTDDADRPPDLEGCVAKCLACPATKCAYVSYSTTNKDCSWYESCDMTNLYPVPKHPDYKSQVVRGVSDGGWTTVAVLLLCGATYVGGGILIGKRTGGARGTGAALHPHYASWIALAALVSDGVAFARAGGKPHAAGYRPVGGGAAAAISEGSSASSAKTGSRSKHSSDSRGKHSSSSSSSKKKKADRKSEGSEKEGSSSPEPAARNDRHSPSSGSPPAGAAAPAAAANKGGGKSSSSGGGGRWVHVPQ